MLKIAGRGNRSTLNIKNRKGSTGVNNAWERIPFTLASSPSGSLAAGHGLQGERGLRHLCGSGYNERAACKLELPSRALVRERQEEMQTVASRTSEESSLEISTEMSSGRSDYQRWGADS